MSARLTLHAIISLDVADPRSAPQAIQAALEQAITALRRSGELDAGPAQITLQPAPPERAWRRPREGGR